MSTPFRVLVLCTGNSARSQIAEALLTTKGKGRLAAESAGSHPAARVNPEAVATLARHGIAWEGRTPRSLDDIAGGSWDLLITVCDHANESCPYFPHAASRVHWGLPDPAEIKGSETEIEAAFESTYAELDRRVEALLALPLETMPRPEMEKAAQWIHVARTRT